MLNIVIFSGGTGSIALQRGLHSLYGDAINVDVIISAYDNGKSTGECRKVFDNKILGPSDLRKNHLTKFELINNLNDESGHSVDHSEKTILYQLFSERFNADNWEEAYSYARTKLQIYLNDIQDDKETSEISMKLSNLIDFFFFKDGCKDTPRDGIEDICFQDFSISNLFYASAAAIQNHSLSQGGSIIADILGIPDSVHLVSDVNLYLHAQTKSGHIITDEGVIVDWNNDEDPIVDVFLLDRFGNEYIPSLDECNSPNDKCKNVIEKADIIIFSSGTQWSSLIPTYLHKNLRETLDNCHAKKYLVMNNVADKDMMGINADGILDTVERFINLDNVKIIVNTNADSELAIINNPKRIVIYNELSSPGDKKHNSIKLVQTIFEDYFKNWLVAKQYFFDFDDTIWSGIVGPNRYEFSKKNLELVYKNFISNSIIISGNSSKHFDGLKNEFDEAASEADLPEYILEIFCNGGNCCYEMTNNGFYHKYNIVDSFNLNQDYELMVKNLCPILKSKGWGVSESSFENRGNCILSIKPLTERESAKTIIDDALDTIFPLKSGHKYLSYINGKTTIDIMNSQYNKQLCALRMMERFNCKPEDIVYVGDKIEDGNDSCLKDLGFRMLSVSDIFDFFCFANTAYNYNLKKNCK